MAVEVTNFSNYANYMGNWAEVGAWLKQFADEYFPGGVVDPSDGSWCWYLYPIENETVPLVKVPFLGGTGGNKNGSVQAKYSSLAYLNPVWNEPSSGFIKGAKTSNGFALLHRSGCTWFFSKTNEGHTCIVAHGAGGNNNTWWLLALDLEMDSSNEVIRSVNSKDVLLQGRATVKNCPVTTLLPVVFTSGTWAPNLFLTHYTEAANADGTLQTVLVNGQEYVYDGFIALKG